jgi:hypothetical protein
LRLMRNPSPALSGRRRPPRPSQRRVQHGDGGPSGASSRSITVDAPRCAELRGSLLMSSFRPSPVPSVT